MRPPTLRAFALAFLCAATLSVRAAIAEPPALSADCTAPTASVCQPPLVRRLFELARTGDSPAILAYGSRIYGPSQPKGELDAARLQISYEFALYASDPSRFEDRYVRAFQRGTLFAYDLFTIEDRGLTSVDPFAVISKRARAGDARAMAAGLIADTQPRNDFTPQIDFGDALDTGTHLFAIARIAGTRPIATYLCTTDGPTDRAGSAAFVEKLKPETAHDRRIVAELRADVRNCGAYDEND